MSLRWNPLGDQAGRKLKNGAEYGTLIKVLHGGRMWRVMVEGYKRHQDYHPSFWEPMT